MQKKQRATLIILVGALLIALSFYSPISGSIIQQTTFSSGFENNNFNDWTAVQGFPAPIISSTVAYAGSYSMQCSDPDNSRATIDLTTQSSITAEAEYLLSAQPNTSHEVLMAFYDSNGNAISAVGLNISGNSAYLTLELDQPSYSYSQTPITITPNSWFALGMSIGSTSTSACTAYFNDQPELTINQNNIPSVSIASFGMFWTNAAYMGSLYVDNVNIGSSPTTVDPTLAPTATPASGNTNYVMTILSSSPAAGGAITVSPVQATTTGVPSGTQVTITATPYAGYELSYIQTYQTFPNAATMSTTDNPYKVTMYGTMTVQGFFTPTNSTPTPTPLRTEIPKSSSIALDLQIFGSVVLVAGVVDFLHKKKAQ